MGEAATTAIHDQVAGFNVGFNEAVGAELAEVFANEQRDLVLAGLPAGIVRVGDAVPATELVAVDGSTSSIADVAAGRAAVLVFYRGAWCPYCNIALKHYNETLAPVLADRGIALIAISPQTPDGSRKSVEQGELGFTVLSDPGNTLSARLGIVTAPSVEAQTAHTALGFAVKDNNADDTPAIPYPTVLILDESQVVRFADVHVDYTTRTETDQILAALDRL